MSVNDPQAAAPVGENAGFELTGPRAVPPGNGWQWIAGGFGFFKHNPWAWIGAFIVWFIVLFVLGLIPFLGALATMLLTYVFMGGFMLGCKEQAEGGDFTVGHLFSGFSNQFGNLVLLSAVYLGLFIVVAAVIGGWLFAAGNVPAGSEPSPDEVANLAVPVLVGLALLIPVIMLFWFAPALIVINNVPVFQAMSLSFQGCLKNIVPFLVYGVIALVLYVVALIPFGLGLLVLVPVMLASIFAAYRDIFTE